jgi:DUF4097 and DUF4098 domain-containing protein YvlB
MRIRHIALLLPVLALAGCEDFDLGGVMDRYREDFHYDYALNPGATVEIENSNGSIDISGWDKDSIDIDGTKYAGSEAHLRAIHIQIDHSADSISIRTVIDSGWRGNAGAKYIVRVPRKAELRNVASSNGAIRVETIDGEVRLKTSNGSIHADAIHGLLDAHTSNGSLEVADVSGDTTLRTTNGAIRADVRKGRFEATTSNGTITAHLMEADSHPVHLESSNGRIDLTLDAAREVHAGTSNSSITLHMPGSIGADLHAHTSNASITSDFDVSVHGGMLSKHNLDGTIGSGGPLIDLGTSNGSIRILRL